MCSTKSCSTSISAFFIRLLMVWASVTFSVNALADTQFVSPSAGSTLTGLGQKFSWNTDGADVEHYWLYVGTTAGGNDIANSGDLGKATEYDVVGFPADGSAVHARLWYYNSSKWAYVDSSYVAASNLEIVAPSDGSTLSGKAQTFSWNFDNVDVERFWLYVGTTAGGRDIADSGDLGKSTEHDVIGIPVDGSTIHARVWYYSNSQWRYVDSSYTAADLDVDVSAPSLDSPANNSELPGVSAEFNWSDNNTPVNYWALYLGATKGGKDIYNSGRVTQTSVTVDELPIDGSAVHARLWYKTAADRWNYIDSVYQTNPGSEPKPNNAPEIHSISLGCDLDKESVSIKMGDSSEFFLLVDDEESPLDLTYEVDMQKTDVASVAVDSDGMLLVSGLTLGRTNLSVKVIDSGGLSDTIVIPIIVDL